MLPSLYPGRVSSDPKGAPVKPSVLTVANVNWVLFVGSMRSESLISLHTSVQVSIKANESLIPAAYSTSPPVTNTFDGSKKLSFQSTGYPALPSKYS